MSCDLNLKKNVCMCVWGGGGGEGEDCYFRSVSNCKQVNSTFFLPKWGEKLFLLSLFDGNVLYLCNTLCCQYSPVHLKMHGSI